MPGSDNQMSRHHLLWTRKTWGGMVYANKLRSHHGLIIDLPRSLHDELHAFIEPIPLPMTKERANAIYMIFASEYDGSSDLDSLAVLIDACIEAKVYEVVGALKLQQQFLESLGIVCVSA